MIRVGMLMVVVGLVLGSSGFVVPIFEGEEVWFVEPGWDYVGKVRFEASTEWSCLVRVYELEASGWHQVRGWPIAKGTTAAEVIPDYPQMYCNPGMAKLDLSSSSKALTMQMYLPMVVR